MRIMLSVLSPLLFRFALHLDHKLYILLKSKFQKIEEKPYIDNTLPDFIFDGVRRLYPEIAFPVSVKSVTLLDILKEQKASKYSGEIYHKTQIDLTYYSNHIEGSRLTHDQTRYIFETNTIGVEKEVLNVDDVIETANHFRCIDMIIDDAKVHLPKVY